MQRVGVCARVSLFNARRAASTGENPKVKYVPGKFVKLPDGGVTVAEPKFSDKLYTSKLDVGTKVVSKDLGGDIAKLSFLYKDGPLYENIFNAGIHQFMKHALSKDSATSSEFITKTFLQKAGISVLPPTVASKGWLEFSLVGTRATLGQVAVFDKLWQSLLFPRFSGDNIKECRRLITAENADLKREDPVAYIMDVLEKAAFKGSPLGHSAFVPAYNMDYFGSDALFDRWDAHYGLNNVAIVATNMYHGDLLAGLTGSPWLARAHVKTSNLAAAPSTYVGGELYDVKHRAADYDDQFASVNGTYTALAFKAPGITTPAGHAATLVLLRALEGATVAPLKNSVSAFKVKPFYTAYDAVGLFGLVSVNATNGQLKAFKETVAKMGTLSDADLTLHKNATLLKVLNTGDSWAATQSLLVNSFAASGEPIDAAELATAVSAVTPADIKKVVDAMMSSPATLVHHGDSPCAPTLADL